ncbi:F0F1 ATP synthase subunit delta [Arsenicicoccus sp. oral taxon 190]|uniref:F0F1 ATP synthase subunit delta n=1 Tax=Arsenicicoccus sp. oral taxon 190 TaxID=1658671 RepID=UPI00067A0E95|nr:F0F1 ATP synthase subunit delta [Arsenicicoccus sp. oral taxon 190]AKT52370.1 ATP synthase subunit delta [Arsenicicoccus sp. oral taxon 190]
MQGASRGALVASRKALQGVLDSGADWSAVSEDLFAVAGVIDGSATLRRALADPTRDAESKRGLARRLLQGKVQQGTLDVLEAVVAQRWSAERDLADAVERLAVETQVAMADAAGRADDVEEQLFRFERTVSGTPELREALADRQLPVDRKVEVVERLLQGKAHPETVRLARQAAAAGRGRTFTSTIEEYLSVAAARREQLSAVVTVASPLTAEQHDRLAAALGRTYGRPVLLKVVLDPQVIGGIRVQVGDEVVDGTIVTKLDAARRHFGA